MQRELSEVTGQVVTTTNSRYYLNLDAGESP